MRDKFLNKPSFLGKSVCWFLDLLFGGVSLLSRASLSDGFLIPLWARVYLLGDNFLNKPPFSRTSVCWVLDLFLWWESTCWGTNFLISLLSRASLSVGFLICFCGGSLPVGGRIS